MPERPLLTAQWRNLILLNFPVPAEIIRRLAPLGTEPDFHEGQTYLSIVAFQFKNVRLFGLPFPGHTNFPEINLRYYVRRDVAGEVRRGVVFAREIVPRRAVAVVANSLYNENYVTRKMRSEISIAGNELSPSDTASYTWRSTRDRATAGKAPTLWNEIAAEVAGQLSIPPQDSLDQFFVEHYWGYAKTRSGGTNEYQVAHVPWRVAPVKNLTWNCDIRRNYDSPLAEYITSEPTSAIIAEGSSIQVFRGRRLN
jgi:uncharacterized protein YqjF (DUF2071 family)